MPFPLSDTDPSVPEVVESWTAWPPEVRGVPDASRSSTVIVDVLVPSAGTEAGEAVTCELAADTGPGVIENDALVAPVSPLALAASV